MQTGKNIVPDLPDGTAEQITQFLKQALQANRISTLFVGRMLAQVRDHKLYSELGHPDLESYARVRLQLGRTSLGNYLRLYEYANKNHPEWLDPGPDTFIPDLSDILDLMSIEKELTHKDLTSETRGALEGLKAKALSGELKKKELPALRQKAGNKAGDELKLFLAELRQLRAKAAKIEDMPEEVVPGLDQLIGVLRNAIAFPTLRLEQTKSPKRVA
jgi:hypothetical protein